MMLPLTELQQLFSKALFEQDSESGRSSTKILAHLRDNERLAGKDRLSIYRKNIIDGLTRALEGTYPVCLRLVGEKYFRQLGRRYAFSYSSRSQDLNEYGETFPQYLEQIVQERPEANSLPYLPDVARLEWAWHRTFYAEDDEPFDFELLSNTPKDKQESVVFALSKSGSLIASPFPVHKIWQSNVDRDEAKIDLSLGGEKLFIWRKGLRPQIAVLNRGQYGLLSLVSKGLSIGVICKFAVKEEIASEVRSEIAQSIKQGWISSFIMGEQEIDSNLYRV